MSLELQRPAFIIPLENSRAANSRAVLGSSPMHRRLFAAAKDRSVFLTFRNGPARQTDLDELAEQGALAVVHDLGDEVGADRLPVGIKLDLAVGRIELDLRQGLLELGLVVAEIAIDLAQP